MISNYYNKLANFATTLSNHAVVIPGKIKAYGTAAWKNFCLIEKVKGYVNSKVAPTSPAQRYESMKRANSQRKVREVKVLKTLISKQKELENEGQYGKARALDNKITQLNHVLKSREQLLKYCDETNKYQSVGNLGFHASKMTWLIGKVSGLKIPYLTTAISLGMTTYSTVMQEKIAAKHLPDNEEGKAEKRIVRHQTYKTIALTVVSTVATAILLPLFYSGTTMLMNSVSGET